MDRVCTGQQGVWWAREELNLRPLPCQQNLGNRCATRRFPRSAPTVAAKGKRSLAVKGNALFPTFCRRSVTITSCRLAAAMQRQLGGDANTQQLSSAGGCRGLGSLTSRRATVPWLTGLQLVPTVISTFPTAPLSTAACAAAASSRR